MANPLVTGIFDSRAAAARAREALLAHGIAGERIAVSTMETGDGIAAEAPGESYENQAGEDEASAARGRFGSAVRGALCTVSVDAGASRSERRRIGELLGASGAREVMQPPE
jgi:hypothetical protein